MKQLISILCLLFISCCMVFAGDDLYLKKTAYEESVYFVQTNALQNNQQQNDAILNSAARQIAVRSNVAARYIIIQAGKNYPESRTSVELEYDQSDTMHLIDQLKILEIKKKGSEVQALVRYTGNKSPKNCVLNINAKIGKNGNPSWVEIPPSGNKYYASIGFVDSNRLPNGGFTGSDSMAIGSLSQFFVKPVVAGNSKTFDAVMNGAYIARRWYNDKEKRFYSLAIISRK